MVVTAITGRLYEKSTTMVDFDYNKLLHFSGQHQTERERRICQIIARRLLSCKSLKVWIGGLYYMKISTALTMLSIIVNLAVYVLLSA